LLYLDNCFLCYDPIITKKNENGNLYNNSHPIIVNEQPFLKNKFLTIGCFNRLNKITDSVIKIFNDILLKFPNVKFVFKTKALLNKNIADNFISKFDNSVKKRISIIDCTILHEDHLLEYNNIDIAIDTFPYSGTTTSCEALYMGVPVFTFYDTNTYFHPQNVTVSLLKNSHRDLCYYIVNSEEELYYKIDALMNKPEDFWENFKSNIRNYFLRGDVCNYKKYNDNLSKLFIDLVSETANNCIN
jgi:predicted O-linked N-acetylglucosamine transferase (SPINDLY family)